MTPAISLLVGYAAGAALAALGSMLLAGGYAGRRERPRGVTRLYYGLGALLAACGVERLAETTWRDYAGEPIAKIAIAGLAVYGACDYARRGRLARAGWQELSAVERTRSLDELRAVQRRIRRIYGGR